MELPQFGQALVEPRCLVHRFGRPARRRGEFKHRCARIPGKRLVARIASVSIPTTGPAEPGHVSSAIATLYPGYFALVMATGIVSIAALFEGWVAIAWVLFGVNVVAYPVLSVLTLLRLIRWPRRLLADLVDHRRGPGFFTLVAGTAVFGNQWVLLAGMPGVALALGALGTVLWVLVTYTFFVAVVVGSSKAGVEEALSGGWLLAAVATQSLAVLATLLAPILPDPSAILVAAVVLWLLGGMQYLLIIGPIFHRLVFLNMAPETWTPLFWVNSGALSITTLAGARLVASAASLPFLTEILPFVKAFSLFFWAAATWWIPLLVLIGICDTSCGASRWSTSPSIGAWCSHSACTRFARSSWCRPRA